MLAQSKSLLIEDLTWTEVRDEIAAGKTTAIYYAASTEQNGPGLALGKHIFVAHYAAQRIAEELGNALVYPTMPYAPTGDPVKKTGHMKFPGTVSISDETFGAVAREVALSAIAAGFKNVALMARPHSKSACYRWIAPQTENRADEAKTQATVLAAR